MAIQITYNQWSNFTDPEWQNGALNANQNIYFENEYKPHVLEASGVIEGETYVLWVTYDYSFERNDGTFFGGFDFFDEWDQTDFSPNTNPNPFLGNLPIVESDPIVFENGDSLDTYNAEIIEIGTPIIFFGDGLGGAADQTQRAVGIVLTPNNNNGTLGEEIDINLYWSLHIAPPDAIGIGAGGASEWPGASLQTDLSPDAGNSLNIDGSGSLVANGGLSSDPSVYTPLVTGAVSRQLATAGITRGVISGYKWNDLDNDGIWDADEPGLSNWQINLSGTSVNSGSVSQTVSTSDGSADANGDGEINAEDIGYYEFSPLDRGTYTISEVLQSDWNQTYPASPDTYEITISQAQPQSKGDFGVEETLNFGNYNSPAFTPEAKITISPEDATNKVGDFHTLTANVMEDIGSGFVNAAGEVVVFTNVGDATFIDDGDDLNSDGIEGNDALTDADGNASVQIVSNTTGLNTITASSDVDANGTIVSVSTDGTALNSGPATKTYIDAKLLISPDDATNRVGDDHTVTATVLVDDGVDDDGDGDTFDPFAGATVGFTTSGTASPTPASGSDTTDSNGNADFTFTSNTTGTVATTASTSITIDGVTFDLITDGSGTNDAPANKTFVDAKIEISPPMGTNEIGDPHELIVTVLEDDGDGNGFEPAEGETVNLTLETILGSGSAFFVDNIDSGTTGSDGTFSTFINSDDVGLYEISASSDVNVDVDGDGITDITIPVTTDGTAQNSGPAEKIYYERQPSVEVDFLTGEIVGNTVEGTFRVTDVSDSPVDSIIDFLAVEYETRNGPGGWQPITTSVTTIFDPDVPIFLPAGGSVDIDFESSFNPFAPDPLRATVQVGLVDPLRENIFIDRWSF